MSSYHNREATIFRKIIQHLVDKNKISTSVQSAACFLESPNRDCVVTDPTWLMHYERAPATDSRDCGQLGYKNMGEGGGGGKVASHN